MMDAGGSPFPHKEGASMDGGITIAAGTTGSGTACYHHWVMTVQVIVNDYLLGFYSIFGLQCIY